MKENKSQEETDFFKETFQLLNVDQRKFEYRLKTHHFSPQEKKILEAFWYFKKNDQEEIFSRLKTPIVDNVFLEATRSYLLGLAHNHYGKFKFAIEHLNKSISLYQSQEEDEFIIYALTSLITAYSNTKNTLAMAQAVDLLKTYPPKGAFSQLLRIHAELLYLSLAEQDKKAEKIIIKALSEDNPHLENFKPSFYLTLFSINFKRERYQDCKTILDDYKKSKGFTVKVNFLYMKNLLEHIVENKPLYIYENDFKDYPELHYQLEVIKALSRSDIKRAEDFWSKLALHNPEIYQKNFNYLGGPNLFFAALKIHKQDNKVKIDKTELKSIEKPLEKLIYIFEKTSVPIQKAELINLIWDEEVSEKTQNKLRKLVFKYNETGKVKIVSYQDTYQKKKYETKIA
jgi:tetratricopeptide (TPR) repeat protein